MSSAGDAEVVTVSYPHKRQSKTVMDSGFQAMNSRYEYWIPESKAKDSGFHRTNILQIPESGFLYMG